MIINNIELLKIFATKGIISIAKFIFIFKLNEKNIHNSLMVFLFSVVFIENKFFLIII